MEVLLAACLIAWAAGAQSEQAKLGISPAQRDLMRERVRHEKAVRKIASKHGVTPDAPETESSAAALPATLPEAFRSGYRGHAVVARVATPLGRHAGNLTARGVHWAKDTGKSAVREYRKRRKAAGHPDPAPVHTPPDVPPMPAHPPMPTSPPTAGSDERTGVTLAKPEAAEDPGAGPERQAEAIEPITDQPETSAAPESAAEPAPMPAPRSPETGSPGTDTPAAPTADREGVGRMAAEVSYDSVMEESDELSLMCEIDVAVYDRIRERCEREIGRADTLTAQLKTPSVKAWITRCADQYRVILAQLDDLKINTLAQGEGVVKAKALLVAGQGLYVDIAAGMEAVEDREFYVSDAIDGEDANAAAETYETQGARA